MEEKSIVEEMAEERRAFEKLYLQANAGAREAQFSLAELLTVGNMVVKPSLEQAAKWYTAAAEQGYAPAQYELYRAYLRGAGVSRNLMKANQWLLKAAQQDYLLAQETLATNYASGRGGEKSPSRALLWHQAAAEQGSSLSAACLAKMYGTSGNGVTNYQLAWQWAQRVLNIPPTQETGFTLMQQAETMKLMGDWCRYGLGVEQSYEEALKWYRKSLEQCEGPAANCALGQMYAEGLGVEQSATKAWKFFEKVGSDYAPAACYLGQCYLEGKLVEQDRLKAKRYLQQAALEEDYPEGKFQLARYYSYHSKMPQARQLAVELYSQAAAQGHAGAQQALQELGASAC